MLVLSYFGILALVPFLIEKNDPDVKWHSRHGLVLCAAEFVLFFALGILTTMLAFVLRGGCGISLVYMLLSLGILGLHVFLIVKALAGERIKIPGISEFADKF